MPGFLGGGGGGGSGTGGEISFPKEFIDPVTKFRVSNPENLIDTDFEYGLQPTKWETVELINNTPSFFSKSGDTTIDGIISMTTVAGTREIIVETALDHNLAVGIPINVTGTKSLTADGSFIIASIPNPTTFTYLCKSNQNETLSINDLYTSIITGEFFQGSQIGIDDSEGILTDGDSTSILTVRTKSTHGFGTKTPLYLLNINSTISQDFQAANTATRSFDASNSATAQSFDGSNTLSTINIDLSNSGVQSSQPSTISSVSTTENTITVNHAAENFAGLKLGTPLYYDVQSGAGYFNQNPRGVVFLKTTNELGTSSSTFQVSDTPDGDVVSIESSLAGTFQLSDLSRTFAGNNVNPQTETQIDVLVGEEYVFDGGNQGYDGDVVESDPPNNTATVVGYTSDSITIAGSAVLDYYEGAMIFYTTSGSAASGLTNNRTYFVKSFNSTVTPGVFSMTISDLPTSAILTGLSGGTGTQTFAKIGVSLDKNIVHVKNSNFTVGDLVEYTHPSDGNFSAGSGEEKKFYLIDQVFDSSNYRLSPEVFIPITATGGTSVSEIYEDGRTWRVHAFTSVGTSTFSVTEGSTEELEVLVVAGGGGGGAHVPSGGGAGGLIFKPGVSAGVGSYSIVVGNGGRGSGYATGEVHPNAEAGQNSSAFGLTAVGGGFGQTWNSDNRSSNGGSGGGREGRFGARGLGTQTSQAGDSGLFGFGNAGANGRQPSWGNDPYPGSGGGGAGQAGQDQPAPRTSGDGGNGLYYGNRFGTSFGQSGWFAGGGGGGAWGFTFGSRGRGGMGGGGVGDSPTGNGTGNSARGAGTVPTGENGFPNTGGGGGGAGKTGAEASRGGNGGSGIVLVRYPITPRIQQTPLGMSATGGSVSEIIVGSGSQAQRYRVHRFLSTGTSNFIVSNLGNINPGSIEVLLVGGGGGSADYSGGGGGGEVVYIPRMTISTGTFPIVVGAGGVGRRGNSWIVSMDGLQSTAFSQFAKGGGGGKGSDDTNPPNNGVRTQVANGGGGSSRSSGYFGTVGAFTGGVTGFRFGGNRGGQTSNNNQSPNFPSGGGGGAGTSCDVPDTGTVNASEGGRGIANSILGPTFFWGGGGGGQTYYANSGASLGGNGGIGGGGAGAGRSGTLRFGGGSALNSGGNATNVNGGNGGANTGGGGGGAVNETGGTGGSGGSGIVVVRYPISLRGEA